MRVVHTSDWHIGKVLNDYSLLEDQAWILEQLKQFLKEQKADVLIIAGDLYDRKVPPAQAVDLLDKALSGIIQETGVKILAVAGNHDSPQRLAFASGLYRQSGLYLCAKYSREIETITLNDEYGEIVFHLMPYADPSQIRADLEDDSLKGANEAVGRLLSLHEPSIDTGKRNVLIAHGFFTDLSSGSSLVFGEETNIGGSDAVDIGWLSSYDYVALGHIHTPQRVISEKIRYSGSLLKYSIAEANRTKSVTVIDFLDKGEVFLEQKTLPPLRDLRILSGTLEELTDYKKAGNTDDYVFAQLEDRELIPDAMYRLKSVYPNALGLRLKQKYEITGPLYTSLSLQQGKSPLQLFEEFTFYVSGKRMEEEDHRLLQQAIQDAEVKGE